MADRRIFHIDLDAFFVSVERLRDPSLVGRPVVVGGEPGSRGVVACASYEARPYGLHAGMPLATAQRLCPRAVFLTGHFADYVEVSHRFLVMLREYTPWVEPRGLDEAYLDLTGFESLYGPPVPLARLIKERVRSQTGLTASVGIASSKVVAKVASDLQKPDGLVEVPRGEEAAFLAPLPVAKLPGVGEKVERALRGRLGILRVGDLAATSPLTLRRVLGAWGDALHRSACGGEEAPVPEAPPPPKSIGRSTTFAQDTRDRAFLLGMLRYLGERVAAELRQEQKRARRVTVTVRYADFHTISRQRTLAPPVDSDEALFQAGTPLLEGALAGPRAVRLIGIAVGDLVGGEQLSLGDERPEERTRRLARTLDAVRRKYGYTALQTGRTYLLSGAFPSDERGYTLHTPSLSR